MPDKSNYFQSAVSITAKVRILGSALEARPNGIHGKRLTELESNDGTLVRFKMELVAMRVVLKGIKHANMNFRTNYWFASTTVEIVGSEFNCK